MKAPTDGSARASESRYCCTISVALRCFVLKLSDMVWITETGACWAIAAAVRLAIRVVWHCWPLAAAREGRVCIEPAINGAVQAPCSALTLIHTPVKRLMKGAQPVHLALQQRLQVCCCCPYAYLNAFTSGQYGSMHLAANHTHRQCWLSLCDKQVNACAEPMHMNTSSMAFTSRASR